MDTSPRIRILLIEDDEDDYVLVKDLLSEIDPSKYHLEWETSYEAAVNAICLNHHDVYLLDYRLGERNGLELLREVMEKGCLAPIIFLTGQGDYDVDMKAMKGGAADYLIKDQINPSLLERSIRYAIDRKRSEEVLRESESQLKHLSSQLLNAQEAERERIARDLHDGIAQFLTAAKFGVENSLLQIGEGGLVDCAKTLESVVSILQRSLKEIRRISSDLWPSMLGDLGILATINWFCREFETIYPGIRIEKEIDTSESDVPEPLKVVLYRIIQEATNNAAKHSKADLISLSLKKKDGRIELTLRDNGQGFDLKGNLSRERPRRGHGLSSMKERTEFSEGSFSIETAKGEGTVIRAVWSLQ